VIRALGVDSDVEVEDAVQSRIAFLSDYLTESGRSAYVLGISGDVDSSVAGRLTQLACERAGGTFIAMRLPYGTQRDEGDALAALDFIKPDMTLAVDIKPAVDARRTATSPPDGWRKSTQANAPAAP
jgi:NAD+ synthase